MGINEPFTPIPKSWTAKYGWGSKETMALGELLERAYNAREVAVRTRDLCRQWKWRTASVTAFLEELERAGFCSIGKHKTRATILDFTRFYDHRVTVTGNTNSEVHIKEHAPARDSLIREEEEKTYMIDFERFWTAYPRKVAKPAAVKSWMRLKPESETLNAILSAVATAKLSDDWRKEDGKYIPHPTTWLNQRRWEDQDREQHQGFHTTVQF